MKLTGWNILIIATVIVGGLFIYFSIAKSQAESKLATAEQQQDFNKLTDQQTMWSWDWWSNQWNIYVEEYLKKGKLF